MECMKKNISKIVLFFLIIQPIIDVITALSIHYLHVNFTLGMVVRFLFLLFAIFYIILNRNKFIKKMYIYFSVLIIYSIFFLINCYTNGNIYSLFINFSQILKVIYIPVLIIFFFLLYKDENIKIDRSFLGKLYFVYLFFIFVPNILNIGLETYEITKKGSIGFFYSANEIGAIISILMPFFLFYVLDLKNKIIKYVIILLFLYILFSMGTKSPLISLVIICLYYFIKFIINYIKQKEYKKLCCIFFGFLISIGCIAFLLPRTVFYKNIEVHLKFLKISSVDDMMDLKVIDHFVFSERFSFWKETNDFYMNEDISNKLLGIGYTTGDDLMKTVEMDYVDIFYHQGLIGFLILLYPYFLLCFVIIKDFINYHKKSNVDIYLLSFILSVLLSFFTGHVLLSTNVFIFVALIMNMFYNEIRVVVR